MKKISSLFLAGILGGMVSFWMIKSNLQQPVVEQVNEKPRAVLTSNPSIINTPFDFVEASKVATDAVVHIEAKESSELAQQRYQDRGRRDPFGGMFNFEDFFGGQSLDMQDFFGRNFYPKSGTGSGVIVSSDGYIVTNNHVVGFADNIIVKTNDNKEYEAVKIGTDPSSDLALLKIEGSGYSPIQFGDSDDVQVGEWVLAVGSPFGYLTSTVTAGIVSAIGRDLDIIKGEGNADKTIEEFIQTDAAVNPGNSGGALVDQKGKLVGINTAIATPTGVFAGYSFAIPANLVKRIVEDIKVNGNIERGNLGIGGYDVDKVIKQDFDLDVEHGFYITEVEDGSGAQFSGMIPGDVIVESNGMEVKNYDDLKNSLKFAKVGDRVDLKIVRNGKEKTIKVKLKKQI